MSIDSTFAASDMRGITAGRRKPEMVWTLCESWTGPSGTAEVEHNHKGEFRVTMGYPEYKLLKYFSARSTSASRDRAHNFAKNISGFQHEYDRLSKSTKIL